MHVILVLCALTVRKYFYFFGDNLNINLGINLSLFEFVVLFYKEWNVELIKR